MRPKYKDIRSCALLDRTQDGRHLIVTIRKKIAAIAIITLLTCLALLASRITFQFAPEAVGIFVLHGEKGKWLELSDDLVPEDAPRLIWAMPLYPFKKTVATTKCDNTTQPYIDFVWEKDHGRGFIRNTWPDGTKLIVNLARFKDSSSKYPQGIFIGGGLPPSDPDYQHLNNHETGMTYFNGRRWLHVWCNSNEGLVVPGPTFNPSYPSDWTYNGSWVRENNGRDLTIESRHSLTVNGVPLEMSRLLFYTAGTTYVILAIEIRNHGNKPVTIDYRYGDEPWIGNFGTSAGNVGWTEKELILTERQLDTRRYTYFGMYDYGNELAGEGHDFTGTANFLEWPGNDAPEIAFLSNSGAGVTDSRNKNIPLAHPNNRFIGLQYGPSLLQPGSIFGFRITIGMAGKDPVSGFPVKPHTGLNP